jgi:hypothetical protein
VQLAVRDDGGATRFTDYIPISTGEHRIEALVEFARGASTHDGSVEVWIDGEQWSQLTALDLYDAGKRPDRVRLGAVSGLDAGTHGELYVDELIVQEGADEIGPRSP